MGGSTIGGEKKLERLWVNMNGSDLARALRTGVRRPAGTEEEKENVAQGCIPSLRARVLPTSRGDWGGIGGAGRKVKPVFMFHGPSNFTIQRKERRANAKGLCFEVLKRPEISDWIARMMPSQPIKFYQHHARR